MFYDGASATKTATTAFQICSSIITIENIQVLLLKLPIHRAKKSSSLPKLADQYIVESERDILLVIGVEVSYRGEKIGTTSTWFPRFGADDEREYLASQQTTVSQVCQTFYI